MDRWFRRFTKVTGGGRGAIIGSSKSSNHWVGKKKGSGGIKKYEGAGRRRRTHENRNPFLIDNFF